MMDFAMQGSQYLYEEGALNLDDRYIISMGAHTGL